MAGAFELVPVGRVESPLRDHADAPRQGYLGAPPAWLVFDEAVSEAIGGIRVGDDLLLLTWLDRARRDVLRTVPGDAPDSDEVGVFSTRSPDRPNPIGLHRVEVLAVTGLRIRVSNLEALDGTPVLDIKPPLDRRLES
jgi:tRNA-Thr(GGU) m(6)t(6)A37 methyltransferase TsaA